MAGLALKGGNPVRTRAFPDWPYWDEKELEAVRGVIESGRWGMAQGDRVKELEERFAEYQEAAFGIAASSGTVALRAALLAAGLPPGAEVIVPAYTFVATATAVLEANAVPVFADIDPETYNISPESVEEVITENTRAIMPVHLAGLPADMDRLDALAEKHSLVVIEDACQAWGSEHRGRKVGALGRAGTFSFQSSKHITAGEGGLIVTNDEDFAKLCRSLINCGRREGGAWHEHVRLGGNYRLSELQAAVVLTQLERYPEMLARRQKAAEFLRDKLSGIEGIKPLSLPDYVTAASCHMFIIRYDKDSFGGLSKEVFLEALNAEGIRPAHGGYFIPVHKQPLLLEKNTGAFDLISHHEFQGRVIDYSLFDCPAAERAAGDEAIWLLQNLLLSPSEDDLRDIVDAFEKVRENYRELL
ncbi:MAG: DegT/DnrJ/EryC1/StrS family aminotransferase [Gemmatimonadota bacterium]|nr:DegT/DnrJ/EryC1/StrS family aminotransferase [Gemmatimonadota bacterium]